MVGLIQGTINLLGLNTATFWIHGLVGAVNAYILTLSPIAGLTVALGFLAYEITEDIRLAWIAYRKNLYSKDFAFKDIRGWLFFLCLVYPLLEVFYE